MKRRYGLNKRKNMEKLSNEFFNKNYKKSNGYFRT